MYPVNSKGLQLLSRLVLANSSRSVAGGKLQNVSSQSFAAGVFPSSSYSTQTQVSPAIAPLINVQRSATARQTPGSVTKHIGSKQVVHGSVHRLNILAPIRKKVADIQQNIQNKKDGIQQDIQNKKDALLRKPQELKSAAESQAQSSFKQLISVPLQQVKAAKDKAEALQQKVEKEAHAQWHKNFVPIVGVGAGLSSLVIWKLLSSISYALSYQPTDYSLLALATTTVGGLFIGGREMYSLNPSTVQRKALSSLHMHPGATEVLGTPVKANSPQVSVLSGGDLTWQGWLPRRGSKRLHMMFPVLGREHKGMVYVHAVKYKGVLELKSMAVDILTKEEEGEHRIYIKGGSQDYTKGDVVSALRGPLDVVSKLTQNYKREDNLEDAQRKARAAAKGPKSLQAGGGMYNWEVLHNTILNLPSQAKAFLSSKLNWPR
mmetsp:Transcript_23835/g.28783  ORF Transcript_23835/g.28783 Transcript_23835/m.28783 type:complete len:433 (+) Transcript_23835:227-1525(+)